MRTRWTLSQRGWWVSFVLSLAVVLLFSVMVGDYLARRQDPQEIGRSRAGEWADLSSHGIRARLDSLSMSTHFPNAYDPDAEKMAPPGMTYLRVRMTIEPLVEAADDVGCSITLYNGGGEELTLTEYGIEGPDFGNCIRPSGDDPPEQGVAYGTQTVYVVIPEAVESFTLRLAPQFADSPLYWTFTA